MNKLNYDNDDDIISNRTVCTLLNRSTGCFSQEFGIIARNK